MNDRPSSATFYTDASNGDRVRVALYTCDEVLLKITRVRRDGAQLDQWKHRYTGPDAVERGKGEFVAAVALWSTAGHLDEPELIGTASSETS